LPLERLDGRPEAILEDGGPAVNPAVRRVAVHSSNPMARLV